MKVINPKILPPSLAESVPISGPPSSHFQEKLNEKLQKSHQNNLKPETPSNDNLKKTKTSQEKEDKKLKTATEEFEAFFLSQLLGQMRKTVSHSTLFGEQTKQDEISYSMLDDELAKSIAHGRGMGLADSLYQQLRPTSQIKPNPLKHNEDNSLKTSGG